MIDSFGRTIDYLRLSVTDRCNLRCRYCMPAEGVTQMSHNDILRFEEALRLCRIFAELGIKTVKVTGGEPLVRRGTVEFIKTLKDAGYFDSLTMTSNGVLLGENLPALAAAGLDAVNISLDTLDEKKYSWLTGSHGAANVLPVIDRALELGLQVKINCVPLQGFNEDEVATLASLAKDRAIAVRFIELMPLGTAATFQTLPADKVISLIQKKHGQLKPSAVLLGNGPAVYYTLQGFAGYVGFISAVSHCFCQSCNRLRLSASGFLKPCLSDTFSNELDLRSLVRGSASDKEITNAIKTLAAQKPERHCFGKTNNVDMFRIGG